MIILKDRQMHRNTIRRAQMVRDIVEEHYQPERHDRCKLWVYRNMIQKVYPISVRTFRRYMGEYARQEYEDTQLELFNNDDNGT